MLEFGLLILAGIGGGLTGSVAGLASLVTYPALLATGLSPLAANVTNTVSLVFNSVGSVSASRPELQGQAGRLRKLMPTAVLGGVAGGTLLLITPADAFEKVVPILIVAASIGVLIPRPAAEPNHHSADPKWLPFGVFAIGVYGGYFGAAAGVLLLAMLLFATHELLPRANALKNVLLGLANAVAAIGFVIFGHVHWSAALPLAIGLFIGGRLGPVVVRRAPATPLKMIIAAAGIGLAVKLGIDAY
ncbi:sulfite exporter TauE/SafE family protein [Jatrophihabitans sp. DSM 45814]